jgi:hypothetical protein
VLLAGPHAVPVPGLALLAAAAEVGDRVHAALLDPGGRDRAPGRGQGDVEAAVAVQDRRPGPVRGPARRGAAGTGAPRCRPWSR